MISTTLFSRDIFVQFWVELVLWGTLYLYLVKSNGRLSNKDSWRCNRSQDSYHTTPDTFEEPTFSHWKHCTCKTETTKGFKSIMISFEGIFEGTLLKGWSNPCNLPIMETQKGIIKWRLVEYFLLIIEAAVPFHCMVYQTCSYESVNGKNNTKNYNPLVQRCEICQIKKSSIISCFKTTCRDGKYTGEDCPIYLNDWRK